MASPLHSRGRLHLDIKYDRQTSVVFLIVGSARELQAHDRWSKKSDPYVICELRSKSTGKAYGDVRTQIFPQTVRPDFNTSFTFDLNPAREDEDGTWRLHLEMWDFDRLSKDDFMGSMSFSIEEIMSTHPNGWFYLLEKQEGMLHNVPVVVSPALPAARPKQITDVLSAPSSPKAAADSPLRRGGGGGGGKPRPVSTMWKEETDPRFYESLSVLERQRQEAIHELIDTERRYCEDMSLVLETYSFDKCEEFLTHEEHMQMFGQLADIRDISQQLITLLGNRQTAESGMVHRVGDILETYIPIMEPAYTIHCQMNDGISAMIAAKAKESQKFAQLLEEGKAKCGSMDIHSFRLKPLQRITKYPLLIKEILKHTDADHPDRLPMDKAQTVCSEVVSRVNEHMRSEELHDELVQISERLSIPPHLKGFVLVSPSVRLRAPSLECTLVKAQKKKASVLLKSTKSANENRRRLLLLEDSIMGPFVVITQIQSATTETLLYPRIVLKSLRSISAGTGDPHDFALRIETPWPWESALEQVLLLRGRDVRETNEWLGVLEEMHEAASRREHDEDDGSLYTTIEDIEDTVQKLKLQVNPLSDMEGKLIKASSVISRLIKRLESLEEGHLKEKRRSYKQLCDLVEVVRAQEQIRAYEHATELVETIRKDERERCMMEFKVAAALDVGPIIYDPPKKRDSTSYDPRRRSSSSSPHRAISPLPASAAKETTSALPSSVFATPSSSPRASGDGPLGTSPRRVTTLPAPPNYDSVPSPSSKVLYRSRSRSMELLSVHDDEEADPFVARSLQAEALRSAVVRGGSYRPRSASRPDSTYTGTSDGSSPGSRASSRSPKRTSPRSVSLRIPRHGHARTHSDQPGRGLEFDFDFSQPGNSLV